MYHSMEALHTILTTPSPHIRTLFHLAQSPPQVLIIEGGSEEARFLTSFAYTLLLSCMSSSRPCYSCDACLSITPYINASQEYASLEKKQKQEHGVAVIIGDVLYLNGKEGVYSKQITSLKKHVSDQPKFKKHIVIIEEFQAIYSIKEIANALLKTMEESSHALFVLTAPERNSLAHTILSRAFILTLPFRTSLSCTVENTWVDALISFLKEGNGWFAKSMSKDGCSSEDVSALVLACTAALCEYRHGTVQSPLAQLFAHYMPPVFLCTQIIQEAEQAFHSHINPLLIADTLATRLYTLLHSSHR
ncbi:MAG: hypothetical protein K2M30_02795 [Desulfovibrionaceae bacterium]|nr:hypothetical protein [Desulfovibrionaceae bacterium]